MTWFLYFNNSLNYFIHIIHEFHWKGQLINTVERNHVSFSSQDTRIKKTPNSRIMIYLSQ